MLPILHTQIRRNQIKQLLIFCLLAVLVCACGADEASVTASATSATDAESKTQKRKPNSKKQDPKWVMAVEGLPELSGQYVNSASSNLSKGGSFALVSSKLTASIVINPFGETSIRMTFREQKIWCGRFRGKVPIIDGTRVELSGEVECSPTEGDKSERRKSQINGWIETKK